MTSIKYDNCFWMIGIYMLNGYNYIVSGLNLIEKKCKFSKAVFFYLLFEIDVVIITVTTNRINF